MKRLIILLFVIVTSLSGAQVLIINELDCDNPSTDTEEFVEIKSQTPNFSTDGYVLVFFNGSESGGDSSYLTIDLSGFTTDSNGLLLIGSTGVAPYPQLLIAPNVIQNGADAVAIYQASPEDFPEETVATITNLVDVLLYGTADADDLTLIDIFNDDPNFVNIEQIDEGSSGNTNSIQRNNDGTYSVGAPTPRQLNDGSGIIFNAITIATAELVYNENDSFNITFTAESNVSSDVNFTISLDNLGFNASDYTGVINLTIPIGQNSTSTTITLVDDLEDEGDEVLQIRFLDLVEPIVASNNRVEVRVVDNDFTMAAWGTPVNPTRGLVQSTQIEGYYDNLDGLASENLRQALQDIIADPETVRAQTYADVIDILKAADQNPENSNEVWLVYSETGSAKLDLQTGSDNSGKWNREHTFPRSRGGFFDIEEDEIADGIELFWTTKADSLRHGNSDAHALRAADASENSSRGNQHYGEYNGPSGTQGSFKGDVARSVLYMEIRYNGLQIVNGFPALESPATGDLGDLATLLDWHRNDPPDDFEMNRNNVVYNWQKNRNPFIDQPLLVEYIWGANAGDTWFESLSVSEDESSKISLYPNPTNGRLYVSGINDPVNLEVYSIEGKLLKKYTAVAGYVDLDLSSGLYLVKLISDQQSIIKKIVLE
ncbi:MAG: endonuclease [Winogradskyella sp.]|nr:endonuclease [Winogradskyella sp.]